MLASGRFQHLPGRADDDVPLYDPAKKAMRKAMRNAMRKGGKKAKAMKGMKRRAMKKKKAAAPEEAPMKAMRRK